MIPSSWVSTNLGELCAPRKEKANPQEFPASPFIGLEHVEPGTMRLLSTVFASEMKSSAAAFRACDVLYGRLRPYLNKVVLPDFDGLCSAEFIVLPETEALNSKFLGYRLHSQDFVTFASHLNTGDRPRVDMEQIGTFPIDLPPPLEQHRIVAKIEELFSNLDAGIAALERSKAKLARYRASLLKAAVEGRLTEKWRAENPPAETGEQLLQRILRERREKWEKDQLVAFKAKGQKLPKNWQAKYKEPVAPSIKDLPALPDGWCWASLDQLTYLIRNGLSNKPSSLPTGFKILRINAVRQMNLDLSEVRYLELKEQDVESFFIQKNDILFTRYNGSIDLLGVSALVEYISEQILHPDKLIRVCPVLKEYLPKYIEIASNISESRRYVVRKTRTTAGQTGISGTDLRQMPIPLCSLDEQGKIIAVLNQTVGASKDQLQQIENSLLRASRLRQTILKHAFEGKLVPQDPNDEPAAVLLERIRREREASDALKREKSAKVPRGRKNKAQESNHADTR